MNHRAIDIAFALVFLGTLPFAIASLIPEHSGYSYYTGAALTFFLLRGGILLSLLIATILLFAFGKKTVRWVAPAYIIFLIVSTTLWTIEPNSPQYQQMIQRLQEEKQARVEETSPDDASQVVYTQMLPPISHPTPTNYICYALALAYVLLLRQRWEGRQVFPYMESRQQITEGKSKKFLVLVTAPLHLLPGIIIYFSLLHTTGLFIPVVPFDFVITERLTLADMLVGFLPAYIIHFLALRFIYYRPDLVSWRVLGTRVALHIAMLFAFACVISDALWAYWLLVPSSSP